MTQLRHSRLNFAVPHNKLPLRSFGFVEKRLHRFE